MLDLSLASDFCQTVRDGSSFFTRHIFLEIGKTKICEVKFDKLLEMLLQIPTNLMV
jgi:hypothetical protein